MIRANLQSQVLRIVLADVLNQNLRSKSGLVYGVAVDLIMNADSTCLWVVTGTVLCDIEAVVEFERQVLTSIEYACLHCDKLNNSLEAAVANLLKEGDCVLFGVVRFCIDRSLCCQHITARTIVEGYLQHAGKCTMLRPSAKICAYCRHAGTRRFLSTIFFRQELQ